MLSVAGKSLGRISSLRLLGRAVVVAPFSSSAASKDLSVSAVEEHRKKSTVAKPSSDWRLAATELDFGRRGQPDEGRHRLTEDEYRYRTLGDDRIEEGVGVVVASTSEERRAWNVTTLSPNLRNMEYAVRGEVVARAEEMETRGREVICELFFLLTRIVIYFRVESFGCVPLICCSAGAPLLTPLDYLSRPHSPAFYLGH